MCFARSKTPASMCILMWQTYLTLYIYMWRLGGVCLQPDRTLCVAFVAQIIILAAGFRGFPTAYGFRFSRTALSNHSLGAVLLCSLTRAILTALCLPSTSSSASLLGFYHPSLYTSLWCAYFLPTTHCRIPVSSPSFFLFPPPFLLLSPVPALISV